MQFETPFFFGDTLLLILYLTLLAAATAVVAVFLSVMKRRLRKRSEVLKRSGMQVCSGRKKHTSDSGSEFHSLKTAVILSVRGCDPLLNRCVEGLCRLKHPNYELFVVLDHERDPAGEVVRDVMKTCASATSSLPAHLSPEKIHLEILQNPLKTCSLKCSALIQVLSQLDASFQLAAFIDGDTIPFPEWLDELTRPFSDPHVDFVTGYRWFVPSAGNIGSFMRYFWNMASFVQMFLFRVLWGGSFAVRLASARRVGMLENLAHSLVEDTSSSKLSAKKHGKLVFAPYVLMACRERCGIAFSHRWCARQMLWVRLYLPGIWTLALLASAAFLALSLASAAALTAGILQQNPIRILAAAAGPLAFWGGITLLFPLVERAVRRNIESFQGTVRWCPPKDSRSERFQFSVLNAFLPAFLPALLLAVPLAVCSFFIGVFQTLFTRKVSWRGIEYHILPHGKTERLNYEPYICSRKSGPCRTSAESSAETSARTSDCAFPGSETEIKSKSDSVQVFENESLW